MDRFWLDLGLIINLDKEQEQEGRGCTWLWRECCLDKVKKWFQVTGTKGSGVEAHRYHWCFTRDSGDLTLAGRARSVVRLGGLVYSQFYAMIKQQFDAAKHYPWDRDDDTLAMMALDEDYKEALRSVVGAQRVDMDACRESYNHCGRRIMLGVRLNDGRSWGVREEHRMSLNLLMSVNAELMSRGEPQIRAEGTRDPFYVHRTKTVNLFTEYVVLPLARWYQEILGMSPEGHLGVDRQKMSIMVALLLKNSYGSGMLRRYPMLWEQKNQSEGEDRRARLGLGLKKTISQYGFGWLPSELFDWKSNNFAPGIADNFPFPLRELQQRYESRRKSQGVMMKIMQDVDLLTGRLKAIEEDCNGEEEGQWRFWIHWLAVRIMRQYHEDVWHRLYQSPFEFRGKEMQRQKEVEILRRKKEENESELSGEDVQKVPPSKKRRRGEQGGLKRKRSKGVPKEFRTIPLLTYQEVRKELCEKPIATGKGKQWTTRWALFQLLFYPEKVEQDVDDVGSQGWHDLPYLHGLNRARKELIDKALFRQTLYNDLRMLFDRYCLCIPSVSRDRWLAGDSSKKKPGWIGFDQQSNRIDSPRQSEDSTWRTENRIDQDWCWDLSAERAVLGEMIREARWRGKTYIRWRIYERLSRETIRDRMGEVIALD